MSIPFKPGDIVTINRVVIGEEDGNPHPWLLAEPDTQVIVKEVYQDTSDPLSILVQDPVRRHSFYVRPDEITATTEPHA